MTDQPKQHEYLQKAVRQAVLTEALVHENKMPLRQALVDDMLSAYHDGKLAGMESGKQIALRGIERSFREAS